MFSGRTPPDFSPNRLARALRSAAARPLIDLTVTNPTRVGLSRLSPKQWRESIRESGTYEADPQGIPEARQAVADYYARRGTPVDPDHIVLTASTSEAYSFLFKLLADPGDLFLAPAPSYPLFEPLAALESVALTHYPLRFDDRWWLDVEELRKRASGRVRGIIVVEPNNPTGSVLNDRETAELSSIAAAEGLPVIADQVFGDFMAWPHPLPAFYARSPEVLSFTLSGLSKVAGLPQVKLGWIVVSGPADARQSALERLSWIADAFLSVGTPVQRALPRLLAGRASFHEATLARLATNEALLKEILGGVSQIRILPREGGWSFVLRVPGDRSEEDWCLELLREGIILHPGHFYDFDREAWLTGSLIAPPDDLRVGMERLAGLVQRGG
jgi:alanine-synthesizing transaminase